MEFRSLVFQYVAQVLNWLLVALTATVVIAIKAKGPHKAGQSTGFTSRRRVTGNHPNNRSITNDQPRQITDRLALYLNLGELHNAKCCSLSLQGKTEIWEKPSFTYFEAKSDDHAETKRDFLFMEAGHSKPTTSRRYASIFQSWTNCRRGRIQRNILAYLGAGKRRQQNLCAARHARSVRGIPKTVSLHDKTCRWCRRSRKQQDH